MTIWTYEKSVFQSKLGPSTKLVLLALNSHVNRLGSSCFPSYARLVEFTSLKRSTVIEHVKIAEAEGWLKRVERFGEDGKQRSNLFYLQVPHHVMMASDASEMEDPDGDDEDEGGGPESGRGGSGNRTGGVQQLDPELTIRTNQPKVNKKGVPLPANFVVTDELRKWATEKALTSPDDLIDTFRNYHLAKGSLYKDWTSAFRMWILNDKKFRSRRSDTVVVSAKDTKSLDAMDYSQSLF